MSQKSVTFLTGNQTKWEIANKIFSKYKINLLQEKFDTPEIQALSVEAVAIFSAKFGANALGKAVIKNDVGYYIPSLNGFPGPFTKFANKWFNSQEILSLINKSSDRKLIIKDCIAYCSPGEEPVTFVHENHCVIVEKPEGDGGSFDNIIIREGQNKVQSLYSSEEMLEYWANHLDHYHELAKYLAKPISYNVQ